MNHREEIIERLRRSIQTMDVAMALEATRSAIDEGMRPDEIINDGLGCGMEEIGRRFDSAELYLPQVVAASKVMEAVLASLGPTMPDSDAVLKGTVVMGTVKGDVHEIGKNLCCAMLRGAGFRVVDLGNDVPTQEFINEALRVDADVIGGSSLMTTTLEAQRWIVEAIDRSGIQCKTSFGGAPCSQAWCDEIGADGYSVTAADMVNVVEGLIAGADNGKV